MNESSSPIGFVAPEPSELAPLLPAYEIHDLIATGGMGAVYRAVQKSLDRTVALKILPMEFSEDAEFCAGFEAEAKAMARLNHPNLIGVHDFGEVNGMLFIVMEFVPGKSIYHSANGLTIDPSEVIRLVTGVCNGLAHAHENGILHRDIKPSNILLTPQKEPKIGDFGLARPVERKSQAGEVIFGTPGYTAPEIVNAPETVDHRADLFSVGVLLHELLTGKLPADDPRPASVIVGCDPRFDAIIRRATSPIPANRHSCAAEIAAELLPITNGRATGPLTKVPGGPRAGAPGPPQSRRTRPTAAKRKSWNFTWVGPLIAIGIMAFCWYKFINMKPRVIMIKDPAAKSSTSGSSGKSSENLGKSAGPQPAPPSLPPPSHLPLQPPMQSQLPPSDSKGRDIAGGNPAAEVKEPKNEMAAVFNVTDLTSLRQKITQHVTVQGRVLKTGVNNAGTMRFLNFSDPYTDSLSVRMNVSDAPDQFTDLKLKEYVGKPIQFSGVVFEHQGALQIQVRSLAELRIVEDGQVIGMKSITTDSENGARKVPPGVPIDAEYFNGKWYKVYLESGNWESARIKCLERRGRLGMIPDAATQDFLKNLTKANRVWIGATDEVQEGKWLWSDGTEMSFQAFGPNEPGTRASEDYLFMVRGIWCDTTSNDASIPSFVCEWPDRAVDLAAASSTTAPPAPADEDVLPLSARGSGVGFRPALDVVGTWKYSDTVQLEITPEGTVLSNSKPTGKWSQRDKLSEYLIVLNDRSAYTATLDKYKRTLTTESRARGERRSMERIDNGPTRNPSAPDQTTAWKMECSDIETGIKSMESRIQVAKRDAAGKWQKYYDVKANGRSINSWDNEAKKAEGLASSLENSINEARTRLVELKSKLGVK